MASDLSSGCSDAIEILDEKEEGEISLEDVSSSEEGQLNYGYNSRAAGQCPSCLSTKYCAPWCAAPTKSSDFKSQGRKDGVQGKENRRHTKDSGYASSKHAGSTLQEKNNDLVPISSDSDMEIVGLVGNAKQSRAKKATKTRKKKKKRHGDTLLLENLVSSSSELVTPVELGLPKVDALTTKDNQVPRLYHRERSPARKSDRLPSTKPRVSRSPARRYRSPVRHRSPFKKSRSPPNHPRSPVSRISPSRRLRSPRRSPYRSPVRTQMRKTSRNSPLRRVSSPPSHTYIDMYGNVNKLLKKVRRLETTGIQPTSKTNSHKTKEYGSSLKEKLSNMILKSGESGDVGGNPSKSKLTEKSNNDGADDEEDLAVLRQIALETQQKKANKLKEPEETGALNKNAPNSIAPVNDINDDEDEEDLELRMIALRSAVLKKHQHRVERGLKSVKSRKPKSFSQNESPFSQSFLDSIPIPGEKHDSRTVPSVENTNPEDMELDTDIEQEREKNNSPYSPSDDITGRQITIDTELLGIQPSDVSFMRTESETTNGPNFDAPGNGDIDMTRMPSMAYYSSAKSLSYLQINTPGAPYSPSDPCETPIVDFFTPQDYSLDTTSAPRPIETLHSRFSRSNFYNDPNHRGHTYAISETPYSPTDTPMYDPDLPLTPSLVHVSESPIPSNLCDSATIPPMLGIDNSNAVDSIHPKSKYQVCLKSVQLVTDFSEGTTYSAKSNSDSVTASSHNDYSHIIAEGDDKSDHSSMQAHVGSALSSRVSTSSPDSSMITVDDLTEIEQDDTPAVPVPPPLKTLEVHIPEDMSLEIAKMAEEPLYLQGVPDITKDANKIPTLVNRALVPASILKTNKQLQQPLPPKKLEAHAEPAFKSAEMLPVSIDAAPTKTSTALFKPIKLAPVAKKPALKLIAPPAFDNSLNEGSPEESTKDNDVLSKASTIVTANTAKEKCQINTEPPVEATKEATTKDKETFNEQKSTNKRRSSVAGESDDKKTEETAKDDDSTSNSAKKKKRARKNRSLRNKRKSIGSTPTDIENTNASNNSTDTDIFSLYQQLIQSQKVNKSKKSAENTSTKPKEEQEKLQKIEDDKRREREKRHSLPSVANDAKKWVSSRKSENFSEGSDEVKSQQVDEEFRIAGIVTKETDERTKAKNTEESRKTKNDVDTNVSPPTVEKSMELQNDVQIDTKNGSSAPAKPDSEKTVNRHDNENEHHENVSADSTDATKKKAEKSRRRSSLDEDEDALRASLLASLAKRSKPSDTEPSLNQPVTTIAGTTSSTSVTVESTKEGGKEPLPAKGSTAIPNQPTNQSSSGPKISPSISGEATKAAPLTDKNESNLSTAPSVASSTVSAKKRVISIGTKGAPPKKIVKKMPVPASTKAVNNAKKYQNVLTQKKIQSLQKSAASGNTQKPTATTMSLANKFNESNRSPASPKTISSVSETRRFVINLASDSDTDSDLDEQRKTDVAVAPSNGNEVSEKRTPLVIPTSDFERSVDQFLRDVRKKQESAAAVTKPVPQATSTAARTKTTGNTAITKLNATPLAVRHLPASRQEEYRRLKQQILEHEKLRLQRALESSSAPLSPSNKGVTTPPGPFSPASPSGIPKQSPNSVQKSVAVPKESGRSVTIPKDSSTNIATVTVRNNPTTDTRIVASDAPKVPSSNLSKTNAPAKPITNLNIKIPNETLASTVKSINSEIPGKKSQTSNPIEATNAAALTVAQSIDSQIPKVRVKVIQGQIGRTVTVSGLAESGGKTDESRPEANCKNFEASTNPVNMIGSERHDILSPSESDDDKTVDSEASTIILSKEHESGDHSEMVDSSASTVLLSDWKREKNKAPSINSSTPKALAPTVGERSPNKVIFQKIKNDVNAELKELETLQPAKQAQYLAETEQKLVTKRYIVLDDLTEMAGNLRQWEMERDIQMNLVAEVKKLREQLRVAEEKLQDQRSRINSMGPKVSSAHDKINEGRKECFKLSRICTELGSRIVGESYKVPTAGAQLLNDRLKQVAIRTRQLSKKKVPSVEVSKVSVDSPPSTDDSGVTLKGSDLEKSDVNSDSLYAKTDVREGTDERLSSPRSSENDSVHSSNSASTFRTDAADDALSNLNEGEEANVNESDQSVMNIESSSSSNITDDCHENRTVEQFQDPAVPSTSSEPNHISRGTFSQRRKNEVCPKKTLEPYTSILTHLSRSRNANADGILCPYELMGTCRDGGCQYIHQATGHG